LKDAHSLAGVPGLRVFSITGNQVQAWPEHSAETLQPQALPEKGFL